MDVPRLELSTQRMRINLATTVFYACLATIAVGLRLSCKIIFRHQRIGIDDYFIIVSWVFCTAMCTCNSIGIWPFETSKKLVETDRYTEIIYVGMGRHIEDIPPENLQVLFKGMVIFQLLWGISLFFVKMSFLQFFSQIFSVVKTRPVFKIAMGIIILWGLGSVLTPLLLCQPIAFNWDLTIPGGKCGNRTLSYILVGAFHFVTDFIILTIPIPFLLKLQIVKSKKLTLVFIFSLGFACCVVSLVRITKMLGVTDTDITWSLVPGCYWTLLEPPFAMLIASLPAMAPLYDKISTRLGTLGSHIYKSSRTNPSSYSGNSFIKMNKGTDNSSEYPMSPLSPTYNKRSIYPHQPTDTEDARYGRTENPLDDELNMELDKSTPYKSRQSITATTTITQTTRPHSRKGSVDCLIHKNNDIEKGSKTPLDVISL